MIRYGLRIRGLGAIIFSTAADHAHHIGYLDFRLSQCVDSNTVDLNPFRPNGRFAGPRAEPRQVNVPTDSAT